MNVDFLNIDNAKLIGRVLPFWARGRKISLLLQSILSPLKSVHASFMEWALAKYIEAHITAQEPSLTWYLKHKLKHHFKDEVNEFKIISGISEKASCFSGPIWRNGLHWDNDMKWDVNNPDWGVIPGSESVYCIGLGKWENDKPWDNVFLWENDAKDIYIPDDYFESMAYTNVYAPEIEQTLDYDNEDYERDIRTIMSRYMINFKSIKIYIQNQQTT